MATTQEEANRKRLEELHRPIDDAEAKQRELEHSVAEFEEVTEMWFSITIPMISVMWSDRHEHKNYFMLEIRVLVVIRFLQMCYKVRWMKRVLKDMVEVKRAQRRTMGSVGGYASESFLVDFRNR